MKVYIDSDYKYFMFIHNKLLLKIRRCFEEIKIPEWRTKGKTLLIQKDPHIRTASNNYWPIMSLPLMWEILTAEIKEIYYSLVL